MSSAATAILPSAIRLQPISPAGNFAAQLTPSEVDKLSVAPVKMQSLSLSTSQSADLRHALLSASNNTVPMFFKVGVAIISGITLPGPLAGAGAGWLFDEAYTALDAPALALGQVSNFIAEGGELNNQASIIHRGKEMFLLSTQYYEVSVGKELRTFALYGCVNPIEVEIQQFSTSGGMNDKVIKRDANGKWRQWDVTDQRWDDLDPLEYLYQSPEFYFYSRPDIENNKIVGQTIHRISINGGAWQRKRHDQADFSTLYAKVNSQ